MSSRSGGGGFGCLGFLSILMIFIMFLIVLSLIIAILYAIGIVLGMIARYLFSPQPRLFGAFPMSRWAMTYEHASFTLYDWLHFDTYSTPVRVLVGSILISVIPMFGLQLVLTSLNIQSGAILPVVGLIVGVLTALNLTQAPAALFPLNLTTAGATLSNDDYALLEED